MTDQHQITDEEYRDLQRRFGGQYVVRRGADVIFHAGSYDEVHERLSDPSIDWEQVIIEYVEPADRVRVY